MASANRIDELARASRMTFRVVADRVGVTERTVHRWKRGESPIPDDQKLALADLFGVSVVWLMCWEDGENGNGDGERVAA